MPYTDDAVTCNCDLPVIIIYMFVVLGNIKVKAEPAE